MENYFDKVKEYLFDLEVTIVSENKDEDVFVISREEDGLMNMVVFVSDPLVIVEQVLFTVKEESKDVYEKMESSNEIGAVLEALDGKFIKPGPGGDFIRTPEVYPTGRNTFQLDPTNIPTETAMERGKKIAEKYLMNFYKKYGRYPWTMKVILNRF